MLKKYLLVFLVSMVPLIELRGAIPIATVGYGLNYWTALVVCVIGNMLPVPIIYLFARKVLLWGRDKKYIGKFFTFCIERANTAASGWWPEPDGAACSLRCCCLWASPCPAPVPGPERWQHPF